uniref:Uncharacterized protein n=1 Tax=Arundo donax TaxID=35708 RepID=A0A0A8YJ06_ARUDO
MHSAPKQFYLQSDTQALLTRHKQQLLTVFFHLGRSQPSSSIVVAHPKRHSCLKLRAGMLGMLPSQYSHEPALHSNDFLSVCLWWKLC